MANILASGTGEWTLVPTSGIIAVDDPLIPNPDHPNGTVVPDFAVFSSVLWTLDLLADGTTTLAVVGDDSTHGPVPADAIGFTANFQIDVINHTGHALQGLVMNLVNVAQDPFALLPGVIRYGFDAESALGANYAFFTEIEPVAGETITLFRPDGQPTTPNGAAASEIVLSGNIAPGATVTSRLVIHNTEFSTFNDFTLGVTDIFEQAPIVEPAPTALTIAGRDNVVTNGLSPIVGNGSAGHTLTLMNGATVIGTGVVGANGSWSIIPATLSLGDNTITATQTDAAGHTSEASAPLHVFDLPSPVAGISTAHISSVDLGVVLDRGATLAFIDGTRAIQLIDATLSVGTDTNAAYVERLYESFLGRAAETGGMVAWTGFLASGADKADIASGFLGSAEYFGRTGTPTTDQFVSNLYRDVLGRTFDDGGFAFWTGALNSAAMTRGQVAVGFVDSPEAQSHFAAATSRLYVPDASGTLIHEMYETGLGREVDAGGLEAWKGFLAVATASDFVAAIAGSGEFANRHGNQTNAEYVDNLYRDGLGRAAEAGGLAAWTGFLDSGASRGDVMFAIGTSGEAAGRLTHNLS